MKETTKSMSTEELIEHMDKWFANTKEAYCKDEYTEVHANRMMGDILNLMKIVRALAQGLNTLEKRK